MFVTLNAEFDFYLKKGYTFGPKNAVDFGIRECYNLNETNVSFR